MERRFEFVHTAARADTNDNDSRRQVRKAAMRLYWRDQRIRRTEQFQKLATTASDAASAGMPGPPEEQQTAAASSSQSYGLRSSVGTALHYASRCTSCNDSAEWQDGHSNQGRPAWEVPRTSTHPLAGEVPTKLSGIGTQGLGRNGLTMADYRLVQHFIVRARPALPVVNQAVWTIDVPAMALKHDHLMHAILGLSATVLGLGNRGTDAQAGLYHRYRALAGLRSSMSKASWSQLELDILFATTTALTVQSSYMDDGLEEYLTLLRGACLVHAAMKSQGTLSMFSMQDNVRSREGQVQQKSRIRVHPLIIQSGQVSIRTLQRLCTDNFQAACCQSMCNILDVLATDSFEAWMDFHALLASLVRSSFQNTSDLSPTNDPARVFQLHILAIGILLTAIRHDEVTVDAPIIPLGSMIVWMDKLATSSFSSAWVCDLSVWPLMVSKAGRRARSMSDLAGLIMTQPDRFILGSSLP